MKILKTAFLFGVLLALSGFVFVGEALAGTATLTWNANTEPDLAGYKIYYGTSARTGSDPKTCGMCGYSNSLSVGNVTTYTFSSLSDGVTYYFSVSAIDTSGNESAFSAEVSKAIPAADTTPPTISSVSASSITSSGATISWSTNEVSDSQIDYGLTTSYGSQTTLNSSMVTSHSQNLSGLSASTLYHYRVKSRDAAGNLATSGDYTFTTSAAPDTTPPSRSAGSPTGTLTAGTTQTTLSLATNESATCRYSTTAGVAYSSMTNTFSSTGGTSHSTTISGLTDGTSYSYRVRCQDGAGNANTDDYTISFSVASPADSTPPVISAVSVSSITYNSAAITWTTNEAATSQVLYGQTTSYGSQTTLDSNLVISHSVLLSGLSASTVYHFRAVSTDAAGNQSVPGDSTFTTSAAPTLSASLSASPSSGTSPLNGVDLSAVVSGNVSGNINYTFYCNRSDSGTDITTPYAAKYDNIAQTIYNAADICSYSQAGTYTAKVIVERGTYQAEARAAITVSQANVLPIGNVDGADSTHVTGWAYDQNAGTSAINVHIYIDGVHTGTATANLNRSDIIGAGNGVVQDANHGFDYSFSGLSVGSHTINVYAINTPSGTNPELTGSPKTITVSSSSGSSPQPSYDTTAPMRSEGYPDSNLSAGTTQTTLSLATNESATCRYSTTAGVAYSSMTNTFSSTGGTSHSTSISGLTDGNTWVYYVKCQDSTGNTNNDDFQITFAVAALSDTIPPNVSAVTATSITSNSAIIIWTTNEASDSQIEYGLATSYGLQTTLDSSLVTSHSVSVSGLSPSTTYHFRVKSKDAAGNQAITPDSVFTTSAASVSAPSPLPPCCDETEAYCNGAVVKVSDSEKIYLIVDGQKRWITSPEAFLSYGLVPGSQQEISQEDLDEYPTGPDITENSLPEGTLIRARGGFKVWIIKPPFKRHIFNPAVFNMYGHFSWASIKEIDPDVVNSYVTSDFYKADGDYRVYLLEEIDEVQGQAIKHHLNLTAQQFTDKGYKWEQVFTVNTQERDYYQTGADLTQ